MIHKIIVFLIFHIESLAQYRFLLDGGLHCLMYKKRYVVRSYIYDDDDNG